jgi:hypothetical protein
MGNTPKLDMVVTAKLNWSGPPATEEEAAERARIEFKVKKKVENFERHVKRTFLRLTSTGASPTTSIYAPTATTGS